MVPPRKSPECPSPGRSRGGFTLLELLTATAILVFVIFLLYSVLTSMQSGLSNLNASALQRQDGRVILSNISRELRESLLPIHRTIEGLDPANRQFTLLINTPNIPEELSHAHTIFWSARGSDSRGGSRLIGYAVRWRTTEDGTPRPHLCRLLISFPESQPILTQMQNPPALAPEAEVDESAPAEDPSIWVTEELVDLHAPGDEASGYRGWLADHVLGLFVRPLDPENRPITHAPRAIERMRSTAYHEAITPAKFADQLVGLSTKGRYDSRTGYQYLRSDLAANHADARVNAYGPRLPAAVEIVLVVADPRTLKHLQQRPEYPDSESSTTMWEDIDNFIEGLPEPIRKDVQLFSTIVPLPSAL